MMTAQMEATMNKFNEVENLAQKLECTYELAWDIVYMSDFICDEEETDFGL